MIGDGDLLLLRGNANVRGGRRKEGRICKRLSQEKKEEEQFSLSLFAAAASPIYDYFYHLSEEEAASAWSWRL